MTNTPDLELNRIVVETLAENLPPDQLDRFKAGRSFHKLLAYYGKRLRVFVLTDNGPRTLQNLRCTGFGFDHKTGLHSVWTLDDGTQYHAGHTPLEVYTEVFIWHPARSDVKFNTYNGVWSASCPVVVRQAHNPFTHRYEGVRYIMEETVFKTTYPGA
jgi:hypothetical protein